MGEIVFIVNHNQSEQKRPWDLVPGQENLNVDNKLLEAHCGQIWETKALGGLSPQHFCVLLSETPPVSHSEYLHKNIIKLSLGGQEMNDFEICQSIYLFLARPYLERNYLTRA